MCSTTHTRGGANGYYLAQFPVSTSCSRLTAEMPRERWLLQCPAHMRLEDVLNKRMRASNAPSPYLCASDAGDVRLREAPGAAAGLLHLPTEPSDTFPPTRINRHLVACVRSETTTSRKRKAKSKKRPDSPEPHAVYDSNRSAPPAKAKVASSSDAKPAPIASSDPSSGKSRKKKKRKQSDADGSHSPGAESGKRKRTGSEQQDLPSQHAGEAAEQKPKKKRRKQHQQQHDQIQSNININNEEGDIKK